MNQLSASQPAISKAIVIGGGIAGLTFALACQELGIEVELYEKRSLDAMLSGPGGIFIQRNAMRIYHLLAGGQIEQRFYQQGGQILQGGFFNRQGTPLYINKPQFAQVENLGVCLLRPDLQRILYNALPTGTVRPDRTFTHFEDTGDRIWAYFQDGHKTSGDILVGADGLYSRVRARLNNQDRLEDPIYSGMTCWRGWFERGQLPLDDRYSWAEFWGQGDRFGYFDVGDGRFAFYGFVNTASGSTDTACPLAALQSRFAHYAEPIPSIIVTLQPDGIYRNDIFDRPPLSLPWGQGRTTLIGDAAHPVQPNLGQGGCMGVEDAFELAKTLLGGDRAGDDIPAQLRQFEQSRSDRVTRVFQTSRQVGQLGQLDTAIGCVLRNWLYRLTPTWVADRQFRWLFDYQPEWGRE